MEFWVDVLLLLAVVPLTGRCRLLGRRRLIAVRGRRAPFDQLVAQLTQLVEYNWFVDKERLVFGARLLLLQPLLVGYLHAHP